ncbi:glycosyltransferase [Chthonobacter albigriseus]|uniref:glycosyltransferase n=1 Tax=Chthonobacter albigriseus TaxID=1683161 RepID=UPI0015EF941E|nr:glycosyltransferase [Chthonobacter albigriseus]
MDLLDSEQQKAEQHFRLLINKASLAASRRSWLHASVLLQAAVLGTWARHPGFFFSREAEELAARIAANTLGTRPPAAHPVETSRPRRILHVLSEAKLPGGHTRAIQRLIEADSQSVHSLAVTQQLVPFPKELKQTIHGSGGRIHFLDRWSKLIGTARKLADLAAVHDIIVLSPHPHDIVPILAFAGNPSCPPLIHFNHADHVFWLGAGVADVIWNFRRSGLALASARRGIEPHRAGLLPLPLRLDERSGRAPSKQDARRKLGLPDDAVVALTVASAYKLKPHDQANYFDLHRPLLDACPALRILLVGPSPDAQIFRDLTAFSGGRIRCEGIHMDLADHLAAADLYLDSTPFASQTSLLEAAAVGLPCVSWRTFPAENLASVFGSDDPSFDDLPVCFTDPSAYRSRVASLIDDADFRVAEGRKLATSVARHHCGDEWKASLDRLYRQAIENARQRPHVLAPDLGPAEVNREVMRLQLGSGQWALDSEGATASFLPLIEQWRRYWSLEAGKRPSPRVFIPFYVSRMIQSVKNAAGLGRR